MLFSSQIINSVSRLLICFSSSANLVVYCATSAGFRRLLCQRAKSLLLLGRKDASLPGTEETDTSPRGGSRRRPPQRAQGRKPLIQHPTKMSLLNGQAAGKKAAAEPKERQQQHQNGEGMEGDDKRNAQEEDPDAIVESGLV